jgi:cell division protein FtsB
VSEQPSGLYGLVSRNRGRLAMLVLLVACIYFLVIFGTQAWRANRLEAELEQQRASIAGIRRDNAALATQAEMLNSDAAYEGYVEGVARRDLGLARPGETVLLAPREQPAAAAPEPTIAPKPDERQNWQRWIDAIVEQE